MQEECNKTFEVLDIQALDAERPEQAVRTVQFEKADEIIKCDILIAGAGLGGVSAALAIAEDLLAEQHGRKRKKRPTICLTEETNWLGGQITSQGVSALDENRLVETSGAARSYQKLRSQIRSYYTDNFILSEADTGTNHGTNLFNPGNCWVSRLAFEPKVALSVLDKMLSPAVDSGLLRIFHRTKPVFVNCKNSDTDNKRIKSVFMVHLDSGEWVEFRPRMVVDATELGDLLPLAGLSYSVGEESGSQTTEPHAPKNDNPENVQDFVYPFVVELTDRADNTIDRPPGYEENRKQFSFMGYKMFSNSRNGNDRDLLPFWTYRRLIDRRNFEDLHYAKDISMINWESNDVSGLNIIDKPPAEAAKRLAEAKQVSLGFLYWLQTEAPRDSGGRGYPELCLRDDILQTEDGLSKYPYIRESRRIKAELTVIEQDIAAPCNDGPRARPFDESVGIGHYPIDIHGEQVPGAAQKTKPFQIPFGSLVPNDTDNLLPACKNLGVTHITNGAYRLHPIEWSIGTAAGIIARQALKTNKPPSSLRRNLRELLTIQQKLIDAGNPVYWFDDVPTDHFAFTAIQMLAATGMMTGDSDSLSFNPDAPMARGEAALLLAPLIGTTRASSMHISDIAPGSEEHSAIALFVSRGLLSLDSEGRFHPLADLSLEEFFNLAEQRALKLPSHQSIFVDILTPESPSCTLTRARFAQWLATVLSYKKKWLEAARHRNGLSARSPEKQASI